jgi:hypothetical protein
LKPETNTRDRFPQQSLHTQMLKHWTTRLDGRPEDTPHAHAPAGEPLWHDGDGLFLHKLGNDETAHYLLYFWDTAVVQVNPAQHTLSLHPLTAETTPDTLEHLLYDQIYPRLLAHEGQLVLHAGAVEMDGQLAVFLGDSGMGKSTLVASLYQAGATLLNDDTLVVRQAGAAFTAEPIYRGLRLLPDSLAKLFPARTETRPMAHYSPKQRLTVALQPADDSPPKAVGVLFFLSADSGDGQIGLHRLSAAQACMGLISNSFSFDPTDTRLARHKLQQAAALANGVPAFELSYPRDYVRLPQVHARIRAQMAESTTANTEAAHP